MGRYYSLWAVFLNLCIIQYKTTPPARTGAGGVGGFKYS